MWRQPRHRNDCTRTTGCGFTLIEVLVVVAIIATLVAILLPSLAAAREQAKSARCLSYLREQGIAALAYATESQGYLPSADDPSNLERFAPKAAVLMDRLFSRAHEVFYCPSNDLRPWTPRDFLSTGASNGGRFLYWWLAAPQGWDRKPILESYNAGKFLETYDTIDGTGKRIREKYMVRADQKLVYNIAISTDQSRQALSGGPGWEFFHGHRRKLPKNVVPRTPAEAAATGLTDCWKNNLYGDGHAVSVRANKVIARWGPNGPVGW
jgi:prepilin-type N-terminal cleavage/methylation domain-containing protein